LVVRSEELASEVEVYKRIRGFVGQGAKGWICHPDRVLLITQAADLDQSAHPLSGEWARGSMSLSLQCTGGAFQLTTMQEVDSGVAGAVACRAYDRTYAGIHPDNAEAGWTLMYRIYWRSEMDAFSLEGDCRQVSPLAARLLEEGLA